jgi:2-hydroxymuconate-semialdehyde hydrolase
MSAAAPARERTVKAAGALVHVHELGDGPAVQLLHGSGPGTTGWGAWEPVATALAGRHLVVVPDQAGFGQTSLPGRAPAARALWTAQAASLMEAVGAATYAVVGHSMGGAVALALAAARPDEVTRVVGVSAMGAAMALPPALDRLWGAGPGGARALLELLYADPALVTEAAVQRREAAMRASSSHSLLFAPPRERWVRDLQLATAELEAIRCPVLLVHGAHDAITPLREAALPLLDALADVRLHVLGRCGHVPQLEHPAEFLHLLSHFLETDA